MAQSDDVADHKGIDMARWPDERKANLIAIALVFALFPGLCWLCWWWMKAV